MMNSVIQKERIILPAFILLATIVPLISIPQLINGTLIKVALFVIIICLSSIAWLVLDKNRVLVVDTKSILIAIFLALAVLSTALSISRTTSFIGLYKHWEGLSTYLVLALAFLLALQIEWDEKKVKVILYAIVLVAALVSAYSIIRFGFRMFTVDDMAKLDKARGTLVGANGFSFYLTFVWPLALRLFLAEDAGKREKILLGLSSFLIFGANILSFTRTGWLISAFIFLLVIIVGKDKKTILKLVGLMAAFAVVIVLFTARQSSGEVNLSSRFVTIFKANSLTSRVTLWKTAIKLTGDRPLFGSGPDTFQLASPSRESIRMAQFASRPKTPHNFPLNTALTLGIPALIVLAIIFGKGIIEGMRSGDYWRQTLSLSMIAALLTSLFLEWAVFLMSFFWLFLAINTQKKFTINIRMWMAGGVSVIAVGLIFLAGLQVTADYYFQKGWRTKDVNVKAASIETAVSLNPRNYSYWREYLKIASAWPTQERLALIKRAQDYHPLREEPYIAEALVRWRAGSKLKPVGVEELLDKAIETRPLSARAHMAKGRVLFNKKEFPAAEEEFKLGLLLKPIDSPYYLKMIFQARQTQDRRQRMFLEKDLTQLRRSSRPL